jgi:hypothetical protein
MEKYESVWILIIEGGAIKRLYVPKSSPTSDMDMEAILVQIGVEYFAAGFKKEDRRRGRSGDLSILIGM